MFLSAKQSFTRRLTKICIYPLMNFLDWVAVSFCMPCHPPAPQKIQKVKIFLKKKYKIFYFKKKTWNSRVPVLIYSTKNKDFAETKKNETGAIFCTFSDFTLIFERIRWSLSEFAQNTVLDELRIRSLNNEKIFFFQ